MQTRILIVDDEPNIVELLQYSLEKQGYETEIAREGIEAMRKINDYNYQLVLLDVMLPGMDGLEICKEVRKTSNLPIILVSARTEELDRILGLEFGADDYITKPFSTKEVIARVKAILRRGTDKTNDEAGKKNMSIRELELNTEAHEIHLQGYLLELTFTEYQIINLLMSVPGKVFSRDNLLNSIWGRDFLGDSRTIDVHIRHIREKIFTIVGGSEYISTVRGIGYRIKA
ncbi:MAG: response regulator transcription factor [Clostridia bacterium]